MKLIVAILAALITFSAISMETQAPLPGGHIYNPPGYGACAVNESLCTEVAKYDGYVVLRETSATCPAGYYYLVNNNEMVIDELDTVECDPSVEFKFQQPAGDPQTYAVMYVNGQPSKMFPL